MSCLELLAACCSLALLLQGSAAQGVAVMTGEQEASAKQAPGRGPGSLPTARQPAAAGSYRGRAFGRRQCCSVLVCLARSRACSTHQWTRPVRDSIMPRCMATGATGRCRCAGRRLERHQQHGCLMGCGPLHWCHAAASCALLLLQVFDAQQLTMAHIHQARCCLVLSKLDVN